MSHHETQSLSILEAIKEVTDKIAKANNAGRHEYCQGLRDALDTFVRHYDEYLRQLRQSR